MLSAHSPVSSSAGDVLTEYVDDGQYAPRVVDVAGEEDSLPGDEEDEYGEPRGHAASRVDAIITEVTCQLAEAAVNDEHLLSAASRVSPGGSLASATPLSPQRKRNMRQMGTGAAVNLARPVGALHAEIAQILAEPRRPSEVREYLARRRYGKVPPFLRDVEAVLNAEQQYIRSLHEPREAPKTCVRLLTEDEKDELIRGLKQQFQYATACYLKAAPKSRSKNELEAELARIKQDIENLSRPYIFVEDGR